MLVFQISLPRRKKSEQMIMQININKGLENGLTFKSLENAILDIINWYDDIDGDNQEWSHGLNAEREKELIDQLHAEN